MAITNKSPAPHYLETDTDTNDNRVVDLNSRRPPPDPWPERGSIYQDAPGLGHACRNARVELRFPMNNVNDVEAMLIAGMAVGADCLDVLRAGRARGVGEADTLTLVRERFERYRQQTLNPLWRGE